VSKPVLELSQSRLSLRWCSVCSPPCCVGMDEHVPIVWVVGLFCCLACSVVTHAHSRCARSAKLAQTLFRTHTYIYGWSGLVWFITGAGKCHYVCVVGTAPLQPLHVQRHPTIPIFAAGSGFESRKSRRNGPWLYMGGRCKLGFPAQCGCFTCYAGPVVHRGGSSRTHKRRLSK
jgi:hypothetical protein